jgi:predicted lysophospholipase L1 biosynthesis ABC-type transport system permease subunit
MATANKGRRRLSILLCGLSGAACTALMAAVLLLYGTPYNSLWWWIMAAIVIAAFLLPLALVSAIEWVMEGYREERPG